MSAACDCVPGHACDCAEARTQVAEMEATFGLRYAADMRAIKRWQDAHPGSELTWPDHADLVVWLLEQLEAPMTKAEREIGAEAVLDAIRREYARAREKHAPLNSGHEAVGVIEEEWDEFKLAVFFGVDHRGQPADPAHEAIQVAAMALAYIVEAYQTWEYRR